jgi:hypothetical protein
MRSVLSALIAATALAVAAAPARAHGPNFAPAYAGGLTPGQLSGEITVGSLSGRHIPFRGTCSIYVRTVAVPHPPLNDGPVACTIRQDQSLYLQWGAFCARFEGYRTAAEQRRCAIESNATLEKVEISIDAAPAFDIVRDRFQFLSPQRWVLVGAGNDFGAPPQLTSFVAHGWAALVKDLRPRPSAYHIVRRVTYDGSEPFDQIVELTVTR